MLIDHISKIFFGGTTAAEVLSQSVGRIAYPLFAYMLVQGFFYTGSRAKYCFMLLITAVLSEPVYDYAFYGKIIYAKDQNVIFTLLTSLILLIITDKIRSELAETTRGMIALCAAAAAAFAAAAQLAGFDYGAAGVAVCILYYLTKDLPPARSCVIACLPLIAAFGSIGSLLAFFVLYFYNNVPQKLGRAEKYAFYLFYPGHLLIICLILPMIR